MSIDRHQALRDRAAAKLPESWIPKEAGEDVIGVFVRLDHGTTSFDPDVQVPIVVLRDEEGAEHGVWLLHGVLRREMAAAAPKPGDLVCVTYQGKRQPVQGKNAYHAYRVVVDRPQEAEVDWNRVVGDAQSGDAQGWSTEPAPDLPVEHKGFGHTVSAPPPAAAADDDIPF